MEYPYTNCSETFNIDPALCRQNCLRREQAIKCCGQKEMPKVVKGKFEKDVNYTDPDNNPLAIHNPILACNFLADGFRTCLADVQERVSSGELCVEGATGFKEGWTSLIFFSNSKKNSYDDQEGLGASSHSYPGISEQEHKSLAIEKHCVWSEDNNAGAEAWNGALGVECKENKDCKSSIPDEGVAGKCVEASRAFCPKRCAHDEFDALAVAGSPISISTKNLIANRELAFVTKQQAISKRDPSMKWWKPRCEPNPAYVADPTIYDSTLDPPDPRTWPYLPIPFAVATPFDQEKHDAAVAAGTCVQDLVLDGTLVDAAGNILDVDADGNPYCLSKFCMLEKSNPIHLPQQESAQQRVERNYAIVNLDYLEFTAVVDGKTEAMPLISVLGTLGGNLGLFMGFSIMTIVEWIEMLAFLALGSLWLILRMPIIPVVRRIHDEEKDLTFDEDVQKVLGNIKKIAAKRKGE